TGTNTQTAPRTLLDTSPRCLNTLTSTCKWADLKCSLCEFCLTTSVLYLSCGLFSLQPKDRCLNGRALKEAPAAFNSLPNQLRAMAVLSPYSQSPDI
ncbi:hypothetical protein UPYG_G00086060, partial [Umbra pygmaea]